MTIKEYDQRNEEQVKELIDSSLEEASTLSLLKSERLKFAYSAFLDSKLVGLVLGWKNSFHPSCTYFKIISHPFDSKENVIENLLTKVEYLESIERPLQTSIWETAQHMKNIYEHHGFKEIRRTYIPKLQVDYFKEEVMPWNEQNPLVKTVKEIASNDELMKRIVLLVKENYEETHTVNPVASLGFNEWEKLMLADDVILEGSYVLLDPATSEILAYSFLHESDGEDSLELGWCGCKSHEYKEMIPQLIYKQIKYARKQGMKKIIGEFDTTDCSAMKVFKSFPFLPAPALITYRK